MISCRTRVRTRSPPHRNCIAGRHPGGRRSAFGVAGAIAAQPRCPASRKRPDPCCWRSARLLSPTSRKRRVSQSAICTVLVPHLPKEAGSTYRRSRGSRTAPPERGVVRIPTLRWLIRTGRGNTGDESSASAPSCILRRDCSTQPGHDRRNRLILAVRDYSGASSRASGFAPLSRERAASIQAPRQA